RRSSDLSTIASFDFSTTNNELLNASLYTVASTTNVWLAKRISDQSIDFTPLYKLSSSKTLKVLIGLRIFKAVRKLRLALYINPVSPEKLTILTPCSTF